MKGQFQSLRELRVQIQSQTDLKYTNMWVHCCLILHNTILEIKEELGLKPSMEEYCEGVVERGEVDDDEIAADDEFTGTPGQLFRNHLMDILYRRRHE